MSASAPGGTKTTPDPLRVVIAGGGTGGHLYPGMRWRASCWRGDRTPRCPFAGTAQGIEARVVPREGFALDLIRSSGVKGKSLVDRARGARWFRSAWPTAGGLSRRGVRRW